MKIFHVIDSMGIGGAEILLVNYIKYYKKVDPSSRHILIVLKSDKTLISSIEHMLDFWEEIPFNKIHAFYGIRKWKSFIQIHNPEIIHTHLFYSTMLARLGTPKSIPIISTYHNQSYCKISPYYSPWFSILDRISFRRNHWRIFVSDAVQKCIEKSTNTKHNGTLIGNFVNTDFYPSWTLSTSNNLRLIAVGSLKKVKNHSVLIAALSLIPNLHVSIDIYGEGELRCDLQKNIEQTGARIYLKGNQILSSEILKEYDAFIMPSLSEGQPVSLLEAMATGLPSLLSDIPSLKELAGEAALYFTPNSPGELAAQITKVVNNKSLLQFLSKAALKRASPFSIHNYFNQTTKLYQVALGHRS